MTEVLPKNKLGEELLLLLLEEIIVFSKEKCLYHFVTIKVSITRRYIKSNQIILKGDYCCCLNAAYMSA